MAHPLATKAISSARVKNDAVDAKTLAHLLRGNLLPEAWIAPPEVREARRLARSRTALVRIRSRVKCQTHTIVADHGLHPGVSDMFGVGGSWLEEAELPAVSRSRVQANLRLVDTLGQEIDTADRELRQMFRGDPRIRRMMAIPGIGFTSAAVVAAEV